MAIPFIPLAIGAGIVIGAAAYLIGELTEEEKREQMNIRSEMNRMREVEEQWLQDFQKLAEQQAHLTAEEFERRQRELLNKQQQAMTEAREQVLQHMIDSATRHQQRIRAWREEIQQVINHLKHQLKTEARTSLRTSSLKQLQREMYEHMEKLNGLSVYLDKYRKLVDRKWRRDSTIPIKPFAYRLPEDFPYKGKLLHVSKEDLSEIMIREVSEDYTFRFLVRDFDILHELEHYTDIPLLIEGYDQKTHAYELHIGKGMFMYYTRELPYFGMEAVVVERNTPFLKLMYYGIELELHMRQLEDIRKMPFIGSTVRIYPMDWTTTLRFPPRVTERASEALWHTYFETVPFLIPYELSETFISYMESYQIGEEKSEWKIGPDPEDDRYIRFQYGMYLVLRMEVVERMDKGEPYFVFLLRELLTPAQQFQPSDIFATVRATMTIDLDDESVELLEETKETMTQLSLYLNEEFERQRHIRASREGMLFFQKWAEVTHLLIDYITLSGDTLDVTITTSEKQIRREKFPPSEKWIFPIEQVEQVAEQLKRYEGQSLQCVYEAAPHTYIPVYFNAVRDQVHFVVREGDTWDIPERISLHIRQFASAEQKQWHALRQFLSGELVSQTLQTALFQPSAIRSNRALPAPNAFFNSYIEKNEAQRMTVQEALQEQDFYLIQGPPGTGKTTVIREIIQQHMTLHPHDRILIISQANVAIDNVLKDLPPALTSETIRCGRDDKMDEALHHVSFQRIFDDYVERIQHHEVLPSQQTLFDQWRQFVEGAAEERSSFVGELGELIIRSHTVIGATCVGLANQSFGIEDVAFDLVLIDEAGKALPGELLIPINRAKKLIVIGDHAQLPPVIHPALFDSDQIDLHDATEYRDALFKTSLFERLYVDCPTSNKRMLTTQYRMPPVIGTMISALFYDGQIENGASTYEKRPIAFRQPLNFFNVERDTTYREQTDGGVSNEREVEVVKAIVTQLIRMTSDTTRIAIITPYRKQSRLLHREIAQPLQCERLTINTVDAFQGDEAEIVIYAMTRTQRKTDYFSDPARLNVAFSRAKNELLIIGSRRYLHRYGPAHIVGKVGAYLDEHAAQSTKWQTLLQQPLIDEE